MERVEHPASIYVSDQTHEVTIVGGGVIGAGVAYFLALRGVGVKVFDRVSGPAGQATTQSALGVMTRPQNRSYMPGYGFEIGPDNPTRQLRSVSFALHQELAKTLPEQSGIDYGFGDCPTFRLIRSEEELAMATQTAREHPESCRMLTPAQVMEQSGGWVDADGILGALQPAEPSAAAVPELLAEAFLSAAVRIGRVERVTAEVTGVVSDRGRVTSLRVKPQGCALAVVQPVQNVVFAVGPWSGLLSGMVGLEGWSSALPVAPMRGQMMLVKPGVPIRQRCLVMNYRDPPDTPLKPFYLMPRPDQGLVWVGTTKEDVGFEAKPGTKAAYNLLLSQAAKVSKSAFGGNELVVTRSVGFRPNSVDGAPIIGRIRSNTYVATGHGTLGIFFSSATGKAMAELIVDGAAQCVDLAPFDPARFGADTPATTEDTEDTDRKRLSKL